MICLQIYPVSEGIAVPRLPVHISPQNWRPLFWILTDSRRLPCTRNGGFMKILYYRSTRCVLWRLNYAKFIFSWKAAPRPFLVGRGAGYKHLVTVLNTNAYARHDELLKRMGASWQCHVIDMWQLTNILTCIWRLLSVSVTQTELTVSEVQERHNRYAKPMSVSANSRLSVYDSEWPVCN